jgi:hypothetical protein
MPYVDQADKDLLDAGFDPSTPGQLTYVLTKKVTEYLGATPRYADFAEVLGCLEATKLELYRRGVTPYEDRKCAENGDVYPGEWNV